MIRIYKTLFGQWRWQIKAANHKIIAASSESFRRRETCIENLRLTYVALLATNIDEL